jgi:DNA-binding MarR family transcriptional regulator
LTVKELFDQHGGVDELDWASEVPFPALLRGARRTYGMAIRAALDRAGYGDMPRNGPYVVGAIARTGAPLAQIIEDLGVSKQAAGQLVDALVERGYLERSPDVEDRRRVRVGLTPRGRAAGSATRRAVDRVDAALMQRVGRQAVSHTRSTLAALIELGED